MIFRVVQSMAVNNAQSPFALSTNQSAKYPGSIASSIANEFAVSPTLRFAVTPTIC